MLLSKANLSVRQIADIKSDRPERHCVHIDADGSTCATDGVSLLACAPVTPSMMAYADALDIPVEIPPLGVNITKAVAEQTIKNMPKNRADAIAQIAGISEVTPQRIRLTTSDGAMENSAACRPISTPFGDWRGAIRETEAAIRSQEKKIRLCISRKALIGLLKTLEEGCADASDESPIFIEAAEDQPLSIRARNNETGQNFVAILQQVETNGIWLQESAWERELMRREKPKKIAARKRRIVE